MTDHVPDTNPSAPAPAPLALKSNEGLGSAVAAPPVYLIHCNFNRIELDSWIDAKPAPGGGWELTGMGRRTEYDAKTGAMVSDKVEPTGVRGWAPQDMFGEPSRPWWRRLFASADRLKLRVLGTPEETRAALDLKDAEIARLRAALYEVLEFQSDPKAPTIHDFGRWRRVADGLGA